MTDVTVVGLGPGPADWVTAEARETLRLLGARVFVRTALHPAIPSVLQGVAYESFDGLYERAPDLDGVYAEMEARLTASADEGQVTVLAVPGDGEVGEAIVGWLRRGDVRVRVVPGVPLASGALAAAGLSAVEGMQAVDAAALGGSGVDLKVELNPLWTAVVTGVFNRVVAGETKLALQRVYPEDHLVRVVHHPGMPEGRVDELPLSALDRGEVELDHLTHVVVPPAPATVPTGSAHGFRAVVARLRAPEIGCPWDLEQTHVSLTRYMIEEAYEVVDAIEHGTPAMVADELGDVLLQVGLHAEIADQAGEYDWNDVVRAVSEKLIRRHPHVFGEAEVSGAADVVRNWDVLKSQEREGEPAPKSALEGVPKSLPSLKRAAELGRKAVKAGFDWQDRTGAVAKVREELDELLEARSVEEWREELGDLLWMLANLAMRDGVDPEEALRASIKKFMARFEELERRARERGWESLEGRPTEELLELWREAKTAVRDGGGGD